MPKAVVRLPILANDAVIYGLIANRNNGGTRARVRPEILFVNPWGKSTFKFPYAPRQVSYSALANEYANIERPGNFPIIERVAPQLMQVSLEFRVADNTTRGIGPIESHLNHLRLMALFPGHVILSNMDAYLSRPVAFTDKYFSWQFSKFVISDLSITVVNRNLSNVATQADVQMTLTEDRNPWVPSIGLPRIQYDDAPQTATGGGGDTPTDGGSNPPRPKLTDTNSTQPE
jgi:hypothetical protein